MRKGRIFFILTVVVICTFSYIWIKHKVVNEFTDDDNDKDLVVIDEMYDLIENESVYETDESKLVEGALRGMANAIKDPYSTYYSEEEAKIHEASLAGEKVGIGIEIANQNGKFVIISPIKGSPADKAGVKALDELVQVEDVKVTGRTMQEVMQLLQGEEGEEVSVVLYRQSIDQHIKLKIKREEMKSISVSSKVIPVLDEKIGHVMIHLFAENTLQQWTEEISKMQKEDIDALIIDVRDNPGGYLHSVAGVLSTMEKKDVTFAYMQNGKGEMEEMKTVDADGLENIRKQLKKWPTIVLQNEGSASASEVLTSALQNWQRAVVVGGKSFGKGTVQKSWDLSNGGQIKLSTDKWLTSDKDWIHHVGIEPDIPVEQHIAYQIERAVLSGTFKEGDFSEEVAYAQRVLFALGYNVAKEDGYFDEHFGRIVSQFRDNEDLTEGETLDEQVFEKMQLKLQEFKDDADNDLQLQMGISFLMHELGN